jgi:hypothetical protein
MNIDDVFPSNFLKANDLQGTTPTVVIDRIEMQDIGDDRKAVIYFQGKQKGVVLNKTNAGNISEKHGKETGNWIGKRVVLFAAWVDFNGKSTEAIRIRPAPDYVSGLPDAEPRNAPAPAQKFDEQNPPPRTSPDLNDEIPF